MKIKKIIREKLLKSCVQVFPKSPENTFKRGDDYF